MRVAIFCASSNDVDKNFFYEVENLVGLLIKKNIEIVTGGAQKGMMKVIGQTAKKLGGRTIGVVPSKYFDNLVCWDYSKIFITKDLFERKKKIIELADIFIVLPGGIGTLDEIFEVLAFNLYNKTTKKIIVYNFSSYYEKLLEFLNEAMSLKFIDSLDNFFVANNVNEILKYIENE